MAHMFPFDWNQSIVYTYNLYILLILQSTSGYEEDTVEVFSERLKDFLSPTFSGHFAGEVDKSSGYWVGSRSYPLCDRKKKMSIFLRENTKTHKPRVVTADLYPRKSKMTMENLSFEDVSPTYRWWFSIDLLVFGGGGNVYNSEMMFRSD